MKKTLVTVSIFILLFLVWYGWKQFKSYEIKNIPLKEGVIVAFGDSLIQGVGAGENTDLVSLLSRNIGEPIVNLGKSGDTTRDALLRLDSVLEEKPKIVIVLLGGNDYLHRIPKEETFKNLAIIIDAIQKEGAAVLLLGVRGGLLRDTYGSDFKKFARAHHVAFVSNVLDTLLGNKELMFDSIHPNGKGYAIIAARVAPVLKEILEKR